MSSRPKPNTPEEIVQFGHLGRPVFAVTLSTLLHMLCGRNDDTMPSFMNFRQILDLLEFKNQVSQCLRPSDGGRVFEIHSHFLHGT